MQIKLAPKVQAIHVNLWLPSLVCTRHLTNTTEGTHNPASSIIVHISRHSGRGAVTAATFSINLKAAAKNALVGGLLALDVDGLASRKLHRISNSMIVVFTQFIYRINRV